MNCNQCGSHTVDMHGSFFWRQSNCTECEGCQRSVAESRRLANVNRTRRWRAIRHKLKKHSSNSDHNFPCSVAGCLFSAVRRQALNSHERTQHALNVRRNFPCDIVGCSYVAT
eukprot:gnl/TRDRNA2_/TRDRNA2_142642_c1_seq1.p1 gnl/TRDRNA2_/TRDRNA2_142642_c1~~gnl/TRDRNA2_/TRDRNA2_142642_c1_seq1.p1  ORF type:complete len:127 (+),score=6.43 gnl/TRDRNA2_/TRDRNA2_142642_c1_seq1:45-383(+)